MAGEEVEIYRAPTPDRVSTFEIMPSAVELAAAVAKTEFVPKGLRGRPEAVVAAILQGHELGLEPMASLNKIHVVDGRPTLAAELMRALVQRAGHEIWLEEASSTRVTMGGRRRGEEHPTRITWTIDDAKRAKLAAKTNWTNYPRAMLIARCTGELCRLLFADVLAGLSYTVEEVRDGFDEEDEERELAEADRGADELPGRPDDVAPPPPETTTRTATRRSSTSDGSSTPKAGTTTRGRRAAPPAEDPPEPELVDLDPPAPEPTRAPVEAGDHVAGDTIPSTSSSRERSYTPGQALAIRCREAGLDEAHRHGLVEAYTGGRTSSTKDLNSAEIRAVFELVDGIEASEIEVVGSDSGDGILWLVRSVDDGSTVFASDEAPVVAGDEALRGAQSSGDAETAVNPSEPRTAEDGPEIRESEPNQGTDPPEVPDEGDLDVEVPETEDGWRSFLRSHGWKLADALRAAAALAGDPKAAPRGLADVASNPDLGRALVAHITGAGS